MREKTLNNKLNPVSVKKCAECGSSLIIEDARNAEIVCGECGFVIKTRFTDRGPEWRTFTPEEKKRKVRVGMPQTFMLHDKGLTTKIDWRDFRGYSPEKQAEFHRIRHWQQRSRTTGSNERNLSIALSEINKVSDMLSLPKNIIENAAVTYRKAIKTNATRGRSIKMLAVAVLYLSCRQNRMVRSIGELSEASGINKKDIASNYRFLVKKLKLFVPPMKPNRHITKLSNQIGLDGITEGVAHKLLLGAKKAKLTSGKGAKSLAASACYIASKITGNHKTQREVSEAADLTEVTIRNRYKEMIERLNIVISL